jgi:hypothetical protein
MSSKITPVLHYNFEEFTEDGKVKDLSGNEYHGTIVGATRTEDMWGNPNAAMSFDGLTDAYIVAHDATHFNEFDEISFICVLNAINDKNYPAYMSIGKTQANSNLHSIYLNGYNISDGGVNSVSFAIGDGITTDVVCTKREFNTWNCLCGTFKPHELGIYINGEGIPVYTEIEYIKQSSSPFAIGMDYTRLGDSRFRFTGIFNEVRVYNQALTPTQARKISFDMMRKVGRN